MFTLILVIIAAAISYLPTSMSAIVLLQGLDNVRSASAFARFIVKVRPPSLDSNPRPTRAVLTRRALTYLLERTIYEGDRTDHGHRERERDYPEDDGLDSAAVHRNADVLLPTSHSCSKLHRKTEGMPTEGPDNLANRRDDKFTDQRGERERERASKEERGREELLALPTAGGRSHVCAALVTTLTRHETRDEKEAAASPVAP